MPSPRFAILAARRTPVAAAFVLIAALAVAGCGGSAGTASPATAATPAATTTTSTAPSAAASAAGGGTGTGSCGEATAALVMKGLARADVVSVTTDGGCHDATIVTTLGPTDAKTALAICDAASVIAYAGDLSSVTVLAANNRELSIGIKGQQCIGEP